MTADAPVLGSTLHGVVDAKYLFGKALDSQPVRWWVARTAAATVPSAIRQKFQESTYAFGFMPDSSVARFASVAEKTETLDVNGRVDIQLPTVADVDYAFSYQFNADVTSVSAQHIANSTQMMVHPAAAYVGVKRPAMFVKIADGVKSEVVVSDLEGRAISDVPVTLSLAREQWVYGVRAGMGRGGAPIS